MKRVLPGITLAILLAGPGMAGAQDPLAANNGVLPDPGEWPMTTENGKRIGGFRKANLDYPDTQVPSSWTPARDLRPIDRDTARAYMRSVKQHLAPSLSGMINKPHQWQPGKHGWYDMVWQGAGTPKANGKGTDPTSGREPLLNTYTGQIMPADTFAKPHRPDVAAVQNHATIYYDATAASMLGDLWDNVYNPDLSDGVSFPQGSMVVKVEAVTPTPEQWPILEGAAKWHVYRPALKPDGTVAKQPSVVPAWALQMSVAVKDPVAAPETGWVFMAFTYDKDAKGDTPWDRFVPLGAQWGNDPQYARHPEGKPDGKRLRETWVNPDAPDFVRDTLGWGGRLAGPMDVATRHEVVTMDGMRYTGAQHLRASSCLSCHGSAEFPFTTNLYPSPNKPFPPDGDPDDPFLLYTPGSKDWARWFQNRSGDEVMARSGEDGLTALDYDMVIMFALNAYNRAMGNEALVFEEFDVH
jgi:hypothetical protein